MLAAVRSGRKTVTRRRLASACIVQQAPDQYRVSGRQEEGIVFEAIPLRDGALVPPVVCPFGKAGDKLAVQEDPTLTLQIVSVDVEQVRAITAADAIAEGICQLRLEDKLQWGGVEPDFASPGTFCWYDSPVTAFRGLLDSIYPTAWARNEWVWVVRFVKVSS
jgi:hypothetical protein